MNINLIFNKPLGSSKSKHVMVSKQDLIMIAKWNKNTQLTQEMNESTRCQPWKQNHPTRHQPEAVNVCKIYLGLTMHLILIVSIPQAVVDIEKVFQNTSMQPICRQNVCLFGVYHLNYWLKIKNAVV